MRLTAPIDPAGAVTGRHVLFLPYPSPGHLLPTLGVAAELLRRGHRVTYALNGPIAERATRVGATVVGYQTDLMSTVRPPASWSQDELGEAFLRYAGEITGTTAGIERQLDEDRPDLIAYDTTVWAPGRILGRTWRVPTLQLLPVFASNDVYGLMDDQVRHGGHPTLDGDHPALARFSALMEQVLLEHGIELDQGEALVRGIGEDSLVFLPRSFQPHGETFGPGFDFVGPCSPPADVTEDWRPADGDGRPMVLISLGTVVNDQPGFFRTCADALGNLPWRVVLSVGDTLGDSELAAFPDNFTVRRWVDYAAALPHASVFVSQAGMGSIMAAGLSGTPLVTVPFQPEQRVNANRVVELGLGRRLDPEGLSAARLRTAVLGVGSDADARLAVEALGTDIRSGGGPTRAADIIEGRLAVASAPAAIGGTR